MAELKGIEYLRRKLESKRIGVLKRYKYYEMKNIAFDFGISSPPSLKTWNSIIGWNAKAVDALADRLIFREFSDDNLGLNEIFQMNNPDVLFDSSILGALISSCNFIYISADEDGYPRLQAIDGANATGIIDPFTGLLLEGYAVLERDSENDSPIVEAYFEPGATTFYYRYEDEAEVITNKAPYPLLVPIINRPDAVRPFGHSRISRACMSLTGSALRTIKRSEISAEFFAYPQRYVTGLDQDAEQMNNWKAAMSSFMAFTVNEDGTDNVKLGQFAQQSMEPHLAQLRMFASLFAGETGLTLDDMGFPTDNPSSAEAIKAAHENLRLSARKAQRTFGSGFLNAGYLAACVRDNFAFRRDVLYLTKPEWQPVFEPDSAMLSSIGDGIIKINQAIPGYFDKENTVTLTGIDSGE
ncbi:MAG: phage portal protein [Solobacterium sp.]|nr:phage portal protein [Solobacterium sp.]